MTRLPDGRVYVEVYVAKSGLTAGVDCRAADVTNGPAGDLDKEAGRYGVAHGETGKSRVFTI